MKIECKQLKDTESGLTLKVTQTAYDPSDTRAPLGVITFTLETGEKLEFQLVKDGHSDMTQATPETIRFMEFEKVVHPRAKENQYFLVYWVFFGSGSGIPSVCGARFNCFMRRLPAEAVTISKADLDELGNTITTLTVNTGADIKKAMLIVRTPSATVTQELTATLYGVETRTVKRWDKGQGRPEGYDPNATLDEMRSSGKKYIDTYKANQAARALRQHKK